MDRAQLDILMGHDYEGARVDWNPLNEKNPHMVVIGETGTGKTQTVKAFIYELKNRGIAHIILDHHDEYLDLADKVIEVRKGLTINPLEVVEQGPIDTAYLIPAIFRRLGLVGGDQQEAYLRRAILRAYGIDEERGMKPIIDLGRSRTYESHGNLIRLRPILQRNLYTVRGNCTTEYNNIAEISTHR
jgi:DNA helicase HerA-like ATPase